MKMPNNPYQNYIETEEKILSKEEIVVKALEEILSRLNIAKMALEENNIKLKAENISKVTNAISLMKASLDFEKGGEIAKNLNDIYSFVLEELIKANIKNDAKIIENIIEILTPIYEGFKEAKEKI